MHDLVSKLNRLKRILVTADSVGGIWNYALELCLALQAHHIEVLLAVLGPPPSKFQRQQAALVPNLRLTGCAGKLEWMEDPWTDVNQAGEWLLGVEQYWQPDIVHLNSYAYGALPWCAPQLLVGHSCVFSWWQAVHGTGPPEEWHLYREKVEQGLQGVDLVIAPTSAMLEGLQLYYNWDHTGLVIPNAASPATLDSPQKEPFVLAVGRVWDLAKNIAMLDGIAPQLKWPVLLAGDSSFGRQSVATSNIRLLGSLTAAQVRSLMNAAGIYALPVKYEPFGLSILEAALSNCALVLGDISSLRELWHDAALFISPNEPNQLLSAINYFIDCPKERLRYGALARLRAAQFQPSTMAAQYMSAYSALF